MGGSADLSGSNKTLWSGCRSVVCDNKTGNYIHYGVREFGMSAIMNGLALYGGFIPYGGTFLIFQSYAANAVRMSALMKQRVIYIYSHDSIGLGEDGPTHQPVAQLAMLRAIPNMSVWRPCDLVETAFAWKAAIEKQKGPTSLLLSRQKLTMQKRSQVTVENIKRGGYVLIDAKGIPDVIIIATGSEVELAVNSAKKLDTIGKKTRVVSMPCAEVFLAQDKLYRDEVLPENITARIAIEAASGNFWYKFVGLKGRVISLERFGMSAPAKDIMFELGFSVEHVVSVIKRLLSKKIS